MQFSVFPKILEPIRRHFGISHRVYDIFVAHVVLKRPCVMPVVGELIPGGVSEHVRVDREWQLRGHSGPGDHFQESRGRGGSAALGDEDISRFHILPA